MKRFLYAAMLASLAMTGCGSKKEEKKVAPRAEQIIASENDMTDEELLAVLDMLDDEGDDLDNTVATAEEELEDELKNELEDELEDEILEMEEDEEDILANLSQEERDAVQEEAMRELAAILKQDESKRAQMAAMGEDLFNPDFDIEKLSVAERESLIGWEQDAIAFAKRELEDAARESNLLGFQTVQFAENSTAIADSQKDILDRNIQVARAALAAGRDVVCAGHAEASAPNALELSQKRAEALRQAFIDAGLNGDQLHATGYGETLSEFMSPASASCVELLVC